MTIWIWIPLIVSIVVGVAYATFGLQARDYLNEKVSNSDRSIGWLFWWSLAEDKYDDEGKKLCAQGQVLAFVLIALYSAWYFVLLSRS